jgi:glyoxylase-like metal-dependent hydrolase (beta-lactamase superfamily II)
MFKQIPVRPQTSRNFAYLAGCEETGKGILVDPAFDQDLFLNEIETEDLDLEWILNTHGHHDHTSANQAVKQSTGAKVANHPIDQVTSDRDLEHGDELSTGTLTVRTLHTPGHTEGSCCFLMNEKILVSGDTLFVGKLGGTSNSGKDARQQYESLHNVLMKLPDDTSVYPGHDYGPMPHSTIEWERKHNPFVRQNSFEQFCQLKKNWKQEKAKWESYWQDLLRENNGE